MNVTKAIAGRRSTRDYTPEPLDEKLICRLIDAAAQAPSAMNQQPWTFTVIRDQALLERVSREARAWMLATTPAGTHSSHFQALLSEDSFQIFLPRAGPGADLGQRAQSVDCRRLCPGGREPDARGVCRGARDVLDRFRPGLSEYAAG